MKTAFLFLARASLAAVLGFAPAAAWAAVFQPVSVEDPSYTAAATAGGDSINPIATPDGRYVLFASSANNLALPPAGSGYFLPPGAQRQNVYLRDRTLGTTKLVSLNLDGRGPGGGDSIPAGISPDGRFVLFESTAGNLVTGDTNDASDIFLRDMTLATTRRVSVAINGACANGGSSTPVMTPDARYVAFSSAASNLVDGDTNGIPDIFVRDMQSGATVLASPGALSTASIAGSSSPALTPDGHFVVFVSSATNLVPQLTGASEVYIRDLHSEITTLASGAMRDWIPTNPAAFGPMLSDDGNWVVYQANQLSTARPGFVLRYNLSSGLTDLVSSNGIAALSGLAHLHNLDITPDGRFVTFVARPDAALQSTNWCVYLWDGQTGGTTLVSADTNGALTTLGLCDWPAIDSNAQHVIFLSTATNLTTNVASGEYHLFVRDLASGTTTLLDAGASAVSIGASFLSPPRITPDGRSVFFDCTDTDLVAGDSNHAYDIFARDLSTGTVELISPRNSAMPSATAVGISCRPAVAVSGDGRYVVFGSTADRLVPNYTNSTQGLFRRDMVSGTNTLVSVDINGRPVSGWLSEPAISADGRFVAFSSSVGNLATGDGSQTSPDIFVRDMVAGTNYWASSSYSSPTCSSPLLSADGMKVVFRSANTLFWRDHQFGRAYTIGSVGACAAMSPDGRFVAYGRSAPGAGIALWDAQTGLSVYTMNATVLSNIAVSADGNRLAGQTGSRIYIADRAAGIALTNAASDPTTWLPGSRLQFSADGQALVFLTAAALVPNDTNGLPDVYLYDFQAQTNVLVSRSYAWPGAASSRSDSPTISADGRFIAYRSLPDGANVFPQIFLFDRKTESTTLLTESAFGNFPANNASLAPMFSADGQTLVFQTWASDLVTNDFNLAGDVFAVKIIAPGNLSAFACDIVFLPQGAPGPVLSWPAQPGASYRVEFKNDLDENTWQPLTGVNISVTGNRAYATGLSQDSGQKFYRVLAFIP